MKNQKIAAESDINHAHWIDNHNGTISCSYCHTWFNKDDRYSYMRYCPYCKMKVTESEGQGMTVTEFIDIIHEQGVENEVFELLTQWMIEDRYKKMVKIRENEATIRAINKIAMQNKKKQIRRLEMKYVWIVMLVIADLIWIITSVVDIVRSIKNKCRFDTITKVCIGVNLVFLFLTSFLCG